MKHLSLAFMVSALYLAPLPSAHAQDVDRSGSVTYDTIIEKRADLRVKYERAVRVAANRSFSGPQAVTNVSRVTPGRAQINNNYRVDFTARSAKRADLRVRIAQVGLDQAYEEWLLREHSR